MRNRGTEQCRIVGWPIVLHLTIDAKRKATWLDTLIRNLRGIRKREKYLNNQIHYDLLTTLDVQILLRFEWHLELIWWDTIWNFYSCSQYVHSLFTFHSLFMVVKYWIGMDVSICRYHINEDSKQVPKYPFYRRESISTVIPSLKQLA